MFLLCKEVSEEWIYSIPLQFNHEVMEEYLLDGLEFLGLCQEPSRSDVLLEQWSY